MRYMCLVLDDLGLSSPVNLDAPIVHEFLLGDKEFLQLFFDSLAVDLPKPLWLKPFQWIGKSPHLQECGVNPQRLQGRDRLPPLAVLAQDLDLELGRRVNEHVSPERLEPCEPKPVHMRRWCQMVADLTAFSALQRPVRRYLVEHIGFYHRAISDSARERRGPGSAVGRS